MSRTLSKSFAAGLMMAIMGAAALLYALSAWPHFVGHFSDDARDVLAAKSLLQGGYRDLQLPGAPPLNFPLPGFPAILAPFVALVGDHVGWLRVVPIAAVLLCLACLYKLFVPPRPSPVSW